jgi:hypothetical protein
MGLLALVLGLYCTLMAFIGMFRDNQFSLFCDIVIAGLLLHGAAQIYGWL